MECFEDLVLAISEDEATIMASVPGYKVFARLSNEVPELSRSTS